MRMVFVRFRERIFDAFVRFYYYLCFRVRHRKYVVIGNKQVGLGNRLIALANMYTWNGKEDITLVWLMDHWVKEPFERLFQMEDAPGFMVESKPRHAWSRVILQPGLHERTTKFWQFWVPPPWTQGLPNGNMWCLYNKIPGWALDVYAGFFAQLKPSQAVMSRITGYEVPDDVVRVQVRNSFAKCDTAGVATLERLISTLKSYVHEKKFFISCMEKEISDLLHAEFPGRIYELPDKDYRSMVDAVADMWILGGGEELVCQYGSSFAEVGWWWRGCKSKATVLNQDYTQFV